MQDKIISNLRRENEELKMEIERLKTYEKLSNRELGIKLKFRETDLLEQIELLKKREEHAQRKLVNR